MARFAKSLFLGVGIVAAVVIVAVLVWPRGEQGNSPADNQPIPRSGLTAPTNGLVQSSSGGNVTIDVTWQGAENSLLLFDIGMNTHSVNLDVYDLGVLATLQDDEGNEYSPVSWLSAPGGHHRMGTLSFTLPDSLSEGKAQYLQLIIQDVAGVKERILTWELG